MRLLRGYLDDHDPEPCGICDNCTGVSLDRSFDPGTVATGHRLPAQVRASR